MKFNRLLSLTRWAARNKPVRTVFTFLNLKGLLNLYLYHFPFVRKFSHNTHRLSFVDSFILAYEIFKGDEYDPKYFPERCETFVDLGCNVGFFTCFLNNYYQTNKLQGLMVDANPDVIDEVLWHLEKNKLKDVYFYSGIVGSKTGDFYVFKFSTVSTSAKDEVVKYIPKYEKQWRKIKGDSIHIGNTWKTLYGSKRVNILKVDIEGAELEFFKTETEFLKLVDNIVVEWHGWSCKLPDIKNVLEPLGFKFLGAKYETEEIGIAYFRQSS